MSTIADFMTRHPVTVGPQDSVQRAAELMDTLNVGSLPVCLGQRLVGIVTDRDITVRATAAGLDPLVTEVQAVMSHRVRCCSEQETAEAVLHQMASVQIRRLPVVDQAHQLVGIVSLGDLALRQPGQIDQTVREISAPSTEDPS